MIKAIFTVFVTISACALAVMTIILRRPVKQYSVMEIRSDR